MDWIVNNTSGGPIRWLQVRLKQHEAEVERLKREVDSEEHVVAELKIKLRDAHKKQIQMRDAARERIEGDKKNG